MDYVKTPCHLGEHTEVLIGAAQRVADAIGSPVRKIVVPDRAPVLLRHEFCGLDSVGNEDAVTDHLYYRRGCRLVDGPLAQITFPYQSRNLDLPRLRDRVVVVEQVRRNQFPVVIEFPQLYGIGNEICATIIFTFHLQCDSKSGCFLHQNFFYAVQ